MVINEKAKLVNTPKYLFKDELAAKFNTSTLIISKIRYIGKERVLVKEFDIYDCSDKSNPEVIKMEQMLLENPNYRKNHWHQQGPCSNWGWYVDREETDEEWERRINKEILKYTKKIAKNE